MSNLLYVENNYSSELIRCQTCGSDIHKQLCRMYPKDSSSQDRLYSVTMCSLCLTSDSKLKKAVEVYYFLQRLEMIHSTNPSELLSEAFKVTLLNAVFCIDGTTQHSSLSPPYSSPSTNSSISDKFRLDGSVELHDHLTNSTEEGECHDDNDDVEVSIHPRVDITHQDTCVPLFSDIALDSDLSDCDDDNSNSSQMMGDWLENIRLQEQLVYSDENYIPNYTSV